jgi:raffinose/stachyose/melibiose transport system permease protein
MSKRSRRIVIDCIAVFFSIVIFWIPFYFVIVNALKDTKESALMNLAWPSTIHLWENLKLVLAEKNHMLIRAFYSSTLLTVSSIAILVFIGSMAAFVIQRKTDKATPWINFLILAGLIIPLPIVPTIWVLHGIGLFKTMTGTILLETAINLPFCILLYKAFMGAIPRELDEAAILDGANGLKLYYKIIFPLLQPVSSTIIVLSAIGIFNDFVTPLYFLPTSSSPTVQLTLFNFKGQYNSQWNLLFMDILLISLPPLVLFIYFNKKIVAGMTAGAVKS